MSKVSDHFIFDVETYCNSSGEIFVKNSAYKDMVYVSASTNIRKETKVELWLTIDQAKSLATMLEKVVGDL